MNNKHNNLIWAAAGTALFLSLYVLASDSVYGGIRTQNADLPLPAVFMTSLLDAGDSFVIEAEAAEESIPGAAEPGAASEPSLSEISASGTEALSETAALSEAQVSAESSAGSGEVVLSETQTSSEGPAGPGGTAEAETEASAEGPAGPGETAKAETETPAESPAGPGETTAASQQESSADPQPAMQEGPGAAAEAETQAAIQPEYKTADLSYFEDACFIGDSFTEGLYCYAQIPKTDYYAYQGVNTYSILKHQFKLPDGGKGTLEQALVQKQYGKIYILLGINELGGSSPEAFAAHYNEVIAKIRALQPQALIFIQSIFHTTQKKTANTQFKNPIIDADNAALKTLADNKTVFYLDINPLFDDETGALRADYSGDGVHIKASHYVEWRDFLLQHAIFNDLPEESAGEAGPGTQTEQE